MRVLCIGDIVSVQGREMLTRVLPSLKREYHPDFIIVNGEILDESEYVFWDLDGATNGSHYFPTTDDMELITVPEGEIFVLGDNRGNSKDSRTVGTIKEDSIIGKVLFRFYSGEKNALVFEIVD